MKVSIIIPCYNHDKYLVDSVGSALSQEVNPNISIEIIIVDDCSTDKTYELASEIAKRFTNVKVIKNDVNKHLSYSRNIGIKNSTGEYIVCLDADDKLPKNYIQANLDNIIYNKVDVSYSNSQCFGFSDKLYNWPPYNIERLRKSNFIHCSAMFKKTVWDIVNGYDEKFLMGAEDYDFWLSAAQKGLKFRKCDETFLWYRIHKGMHDTVSTKNKKKIKRQLKKKYGNFYLEG